MPVPAVRGSSALIMIGWIPYILTVVAVLVLRLDEWFDEVVRKKSTQGV